MPNIWMNRIILLRVEPLETSDATEEAYSQEIKRTYERDQTSVGRGHEIAHHREVTGSRRVCVSRVLSTRA